MSEKKNTSSGAEKTEKLAAKKTTSQKSSKGTVKSTAAKTQTAKRKQTDAERKKAQEMRMKAEKKQAKLEKKLEARQKRLDRIAAMREKRAERTEERRRRRDKLKHESEKERAERIKSERAAKMEARNAKREAAAAERRAKREHRLKLRAQKMAEKQNKRHAPGFGGWLAAVISLGVTCLALASVVTYGWMNMSDMQASMNGSQTQALYELNSVVDNLDGNLAKARVSSSSSDRARVLADIAIQSEMAEMILERMPLDGTSTAQLSAFVNKMGDAAQNMLYTVADGGELTEWQTASIEYMYRTNKQIKNVLNELVSKAGTKDIEAVLRGNQSIISDSFFDLENNVIEAPKGIFDGPFADEINDTNISFFEGLKEISCEEAEKMAAEIFKDYKVTDTRCTGETVTANMSLYNISMTAEDGEMFAQLSKKGGKLVMFDSYKECTEHKFDGAHCETIAEEFLKAAGYDDMKAVWMSENGTTCNINFAPVQNGVIIYPDMIKVKVCEERGIVTGAEAISYILNHSQRDIAEASITEAQAKSSIDGRLDITSSKLALIPLEDNEVLCYEFHGTYDGGEYYVYVDARTGNEVQVLTVIGTAQGKNAL